MKKIEDFIQERELLNEKTLQFGQKNIKRFFNLDWNTYKEGALDKKTKEMLGLVASMVLRCDDCINYHMIECFKAGIKDEELEEVFSVALIVGGSIVIPHLRRAVAQWEEIKEYLSLEGNPEKKQLFQNLYKKTEDFIRTEKDKSKVMRYIVDLLDQEIEYYNWTGFYLAEPSTRKLNLGEYTGEPTEHVGISYGVGICGQAAETNETFLVPDVSLQSNYLACSLKTKSEIVVPVFNNKKEFVAELDIDSHQLNPFDSIDKYYLEKICDLLGKLF